MMVLPRFQQMSVLTLLDIETVDVIGDGLVIATRPDQARRVIDCLSGENAHQLLSQLETCIRKYDAQHKDIE